MTTSLNKSSKTDENTNNPIYLDKTFEGFEIPTEIDLTEILNRKASIKTKKKLNHGDVVGINIPIMGDICSVVGKVEDIMLLENGWKIFLDLEYVPVELIKDLELYPSHNI